ncbi:MAG: response regulator [Myxococcota bacterium]
MAVVLVFVVLVAALDWVTPLGYVEWMLYVAPVGIAAVGRRPLLPLATAALSVTLLVLGFLLTDDQVVASHLAIVNRAIGSGVVSVMGVMGTAFVRTRVRVEHEAWLREREHRLQSALEGNPSLAEVGERTLDVLVDALGAAVGAFHVTTDGHTLRRLAGHGVEANDEPVELGDTLVGRCAKDRALKVVRDLPSDYLVARSGLGNAAPVTLAMIPAMAGDAVNGVVELGFFREPSERALQLMERLEQVVGVAVRAADYRERIDRLLEETQRQAEELQTQQEELRVTNEELESQANALRESQAQLEIQQSDLERSNAELEEQTAQLEERQQELVRARVELEEANRHKSQFLANMSHELRTPLNSTLILAKILADDAPGTLTPDQVKSAETIYAAGNDLLTLINDILDLSKIEAGRMDMAAQDLRVEDVVGQVERLVRPLAADKRLSFSVEIAAAAPAALVSDGTRVKQILRNLLSNALKFTERGSVRIEVAPAPEGIAFAVRDTGPGIPADQQRLVFEPFRQLEGHVNRAGGTGLGLSISRNLARALGGDLTLQSTPGEGSTFTLTLPLQPPAGARPAPPVTAHDPGPAPLAAPQPPRRAPSPAEALPASTFLPDDRDDLRPGDVCLLIVEDDKRFASIVMDLAHELNLPCLVARTGEEAMELARRMRPTGVVLDVRLPDESGLTVLERIKRDPATRHIPVHMVSGVDQSDTALRLGAVGYAIKPVVREQLLEALGRLQRTASDAPRSVLVVEDDPIQRESICRLIGTERVDTEAVGTVQGALELLGERTFDCMIVDLRLADGSGFDLLDQLAEGDRYAFPPVIVYTGKSLTPDEEQRLRAYSQSVIVKGARSPERLLDEVALFLHQVEQTLPPEHQRMLKVARARDAALEDRRILIVEDDVRNVFALTSLLEPRGAVVEIARNGQEAVERMQQEPKVDLVLMDVMMPVMDGLEATRRIREMPSCKKVPIITLTAKAMKDDQEECLAAGANDYASKPLDVDKLLSLIRVWMPHGRR